MTTEPTIWTWESVNAPELDRFIARIRTPQGIVLPVLITGPTEEVALTMAEAFWDSELSKYQAREASARKAELAMAAKKTQTQAKKAV